MQEVFEKIIGKIKTDSSVKLYGSKNSGNYMIPVDKAIEIVERAAAEYNNGWIPCSERLPDVPEGIEDDECPEFNVTIKGADQAATLKCASDGTWFDDLGYTYDVIAWQPLPDTYQPKGE